MPWDKKTVDGKICVYKKTTGKIMHCYEGDGADEKANKYLAALHMHASEKDLKEWLEFEGKEAALAILKQSDGKYKIIGVSTAALEDKEEETFDVDAMDYDIAMAEKTGEYPEFRMFHKSYLGIGKVEKMRRVGIFAVDEGTSYDDPFSLGVCEKILSDNTGKWRMSRGFYVLEAKGGCPNCGEDLVIANKHMIAGFKCPSCKSIHLGYKGVLRKVHFRKTKTFDDTITDVPCVPFTGVAAFKISDLEDLPMNKKQLKEKLLAAGVDEAAVDERLAHVTEKQLTALDEIPEAKLLKELQLEEEAEEAEDKEEINDNEQVVVLDPSVLKDFGKIVEDKIQTAFDGLEIDIPETKEDAITELKEQFEELADAVNKMADVLEKLVEKDDARLKELAANLPRNAKFRVARFKKADAEDAEDEMDAGDDEEAEGDMPMPMHSKKKKQLPDVTTGVVYGSDGQVHASLSDSLFGEQ